MDLFGVDFKPREANVASLSGVKKTSYFLFSGVLNPSSPMGSDQARFAGSLKATAGAFANSTWNEAQLPNSLRQFLTQARVPTSGTGTCTDTAK